MIEINRSVYRLVVYANKVNRWDFLRFACYSSLRSDKVPAFFVKEIRSTVCIDLSLSEDDLLMGMKSNTRNEIRKGIRDGYLFELSDNVNEFVKYYNEFAEEKGLDKIGELSVKKYDKYIITKCLFDNHILAMHVSILDNTNHIARLLYSASLRLQVNVDRKSISIANRFLHYQELLYFRDIGLKQYDFAGICEDEKNKELFGIGQFKKGFGGTVVPAIFVYSPLLYMLLIFKKFLKKFRN